MSYYLVSDFRQGVDTRRLAESAVTGTLRWLSGGFVNSGGEVEKLRAFQTQPVLGAALADAAKRGGWAGPVRTADGGFLFVGPGDRPEGMPATLGGATVYWSRLPGAPATLDGIGGAELFGDRSYLSLGFSGFTTHQHWSGFPGQDFEQVERADEDEVPTSLDTPHIRAIASKMVRAVGSTIAFSAVGDPTDLTGAGSGSVNVTTADGGMGSIRGLGIYFDELAVFGEAGVQIWALDPDPDQTQLRQTIGGLGAVSGRTVMTYDNGDVLFLTPYGIRSLRARDQTTFAVGDDVGSPVDELVRNTLLSGSPSQEGVSGAAPSSRRPHPGEMVSLIDPTTGQLWIIAGSTAFVFSRFSNANVRAWSFAELPGAQLGGGAGYVRGAAVASDALLICTAEGQAFLYGGDDGLSYDDTPCVVQTPFMAMDAPATTKRFTGLDIISRGEWRVEVALDPTQPDLFETVGVIGGTTTQMQQIAMSGASTHLAVRLTSTDSRVPARIGQIAIHFREGRAA